MMEYIRYTKEGELDMLPHPQLRHFCGCRRRLVYSSDDLKDLGALQNTSG
jgi:hypothetical protein